MEMKSSECPLYLRVQVARVAASFPGLLDPNLENWDQNLKLLLDQIWSYAFAEGCGYQLSLKPAVVQLQVSPEQEERIIAHFLKIKEREV